MLLSNSAPNRYFDLHNSLHLCPKYGLFPDLQFFLIKAKFPVFLFYNGSL